MKIILGIAKKKSQLFFFRNDQRTGTREVSIYSYKLFEKLRKNAASSLGF